MKPSGGSWRAKLLAAVAADLGRSKPWVRTWVDRYDPTDEGWADSHSRA